MNIAMMKKPLIPFALVGVVLGLAGCGGGATDSGQENRENAPPPVDDSANNVVYNGPLAATDDVTAFRVEVWEFLTQDDKCGGCHNEDVGQEPMFMRRDDINLAYEATLPLVDKAAPVLSQLVVRAQEGHNTWNDSAADQITNVIGRWATATGASANELVLTPPAEIRVVGEALQFPATSDLYSTTIYPLVTDTGAANCVFCHSENSAQRQQPFFASSNIDTAYSAARTLIELDVDNISGSRFIERMEEGHNTWVDPSGVMDQSAYSVQEMTRVVSDFVNSLEPQEVPEAWLVSSEVIIAGAAGEPGIGQIVSAAGRVETDVIALYQFKQGSGTVAYDTSTVEPQLNLNIYGDHEWVGSWGLTFSDGGKAQASSGSEKLNDLIRLTGEYSIEAWVVPGNVSQEDARIVTYSGNSQDRNFALVQTLYDYEFYSRTSNSDAGGAPLLNTPSMDEVLQATLQHVVVTYDSIEGRRVYVNGELIVEDAEAGDLNGWDPGFVLGVGNEVVNGRAWVGTVRLLAIHNRVLTEEQVLTNFEAGVGQKYMLFFNVSEFVGQDDAYVVFEVEQYDNYSYLFQSPFFIILDETRSAPAASLPIRGMRIGVNGSEAPIGQAFANIDVTIDPADYDSSTGVPLASNPAGTIIGLERGIENDLFFLTFEQIGTCSDCTYNRPADEVPEPGARTAADAQPDIGLRIFDEVFHNMSGLTTVPPNKALSDGSGDTIYDFYANEIRRSLPSAPSASGFLASQQSAVTQLALAFCTELVSDTTLRNAYFGDYDDLSDQSEVDALVDPLLNRMLILADGSVSTSASVAEMKLRIDNVGVDDGNDATNNPEEFDGLLQVMSANTTSAKATAVCTSVLASAAMLMQ